MPKNKETKTQQAMALVVIALLAYCLFSFGYYRFSNPDRTETQLLYDIPKALLWNW